jgi:hypothetical protein
MLLDENFMNYILISVVLCVFSVYLCVTITDKLRRGSAEFRGEFLIYHFPQNHRFIETLSLPGSLS